MFSTRTAEPASDPILRITDLQVDFTTDHGNVHAVRGVDVEVARSAIVGLVGESGSGKSATALSVLRLLHARGRIVGGRIEFDGIDITGLPLARMRDLRGSRISLVPQDPMSALNPGLRIGAQMRLAMRSHGRTSRSEILDESIRALETVGIPHPDLAIRRYPHELSGGQRQRIVIALALIGGADFLIADEATTALDATTQVRILELLADLRRERGLSLLLITHDFAVVEAICDDVYVMWKGKVVERGPVRRVFSRPEHEYSASLLSYIPDPTRRGVSLGAVNQ